MNARVGQLFGVANKNLSCEGRFRTALLSEFNLHKLSPESVLGEMDGQSHITGMDPNCHIC